MALLLIIFILTAKYVRSDEDKGQITGNQLTQIKTGAYLHIGHQTTRPQPNGRSRHSVWSDERSKYSSEELKSNTAGTVSSKGGRMKGFWTLLKLAYENVE